MIEIYALHKFGDVYTGISLPYVYLLCCLVFAFHLMLQLLLDDCGFFSFNFRIFHRIIGHFLGCRFFNYLNFLLFLFKAMDVERMKIDCCFHRHRGLLLMLVLNLLSGGLIFFCVMPRQGHERISIILVACWREDSLGWPA